MFLCWFAVWVCWVWVVCVADGFLRFSDWVALLIVLLVLFLILFVCILWLCGCVCVYLWWLVILTVSCCEIWYCPLFWFLIVWVLWLLRLVCWFCLVFALLFLFNTFVFAGCCLLVVTCMFGDWTMYFVVLDVALVLFVLALGSFDLSVALFEFEVLVFGFVVCGLNCFVITFVDGFGLVACSLCDGDFLGWFSFDFGLYCSFRWFDGLWFGLWCLFCMMVLGLRLIAFVD